MPPKLQLLALLAFAVAMFFLENQIQKLEESRGKLGKLSPGLPGRRAACGVFSPSGSIQISASPLLHLGQYKAV